MTLDEIAKELVAANREERVRPMLDALYSPDCVSVEAAAFDPASGREATGISAIKAKHDWWDGEFEVHKLGVDGPYLHGDDRFSVIYEVDVTHKQSGSRQAMREVAVYFVREGKVVREEFFQAAG